ncbi:hypothetical protein BJ878DRAFT_427617 [Calycina marina]|uniref:Fe2OG dioxygenase domain-containing protein n=1 Tax=Calycina marina TaxID=1763456 RepID=A0A9P7YXQ8_9HELO|nr:hypothetical protein BJ878DRAFT_427617 [Calycina marina]
MAAVSANLQHVSSPKTDLDINKIKTWDNGLIMHEDFMSPEEEAAAIASIEADTRWTGIGKRQTLQFGYHFDYTTFEASQTDETPLPSYLSKLLSHLPLFTETSTNADGTKEDRKYKPNQFTVQYYPPGTGIPPHVDTHSAFREAMYCLSLGSAVAIVFKKCGETEARRIRKPKRSLFKITTPAVPTMVGSSTPPLDQPSAASNALVPADGHLEDHSQFEENPWEVLLPPRSLLVFSGPSRYGYSHRIKGRKFDRLVDGTMLEREDRYSITMRTVVRDGTPCRCDFPDVCDTRILEEDTRGANEEAKVDTF